jgi:DNA helicase HerA-like ATPase
VANYFTDTIAKLASVDLFARDRDGKFSAGLFVGRPFYVDYERLYLLVADSWKLRAKGLPQGSFLLAYYENEDDVSEALLLRVLKPCKLPTDNDVISSMIEYFKDNLRTSGQQSQLDSFTRYEFSFSGLECRVLGTFYQDANGRIQFGADVENFYSAHHYSVIKPKPDVLEAIVNFREGEVSGRPSDVRIGRVRYSSSRRFQEQEATVPVYVRPQDFLGKRTALFGMTRTGKSNTVKKIIEATVRMSERARDTLAEKSPGKLFAQELLEPFDKDGMPKYRAGQIIFDINGEYANPNLQDAGTAIYEMFKDQTTRYSVIPKDGFKVMKVNFYSEVVSGFELVRSHLAEENSDYVRSFLAIDLEKPDDYDTNYSARNRYDRKVAAYQCCLYKAGLPVPKGIQAKFQGKRELNQLVKADGSIDPTKGINLEESIEWFSTIWEHYETFPFLKDYKANNGHEWADEDLKALLIFLTQRKKPGGNRDVSGYLKLRGLKELHTDTIGKPFEEEIMAELRAGGIVIVDLSQGNPEVQRLYSERICRQIFNDAMGRFIRSEPNNFIQFYFEEAHNLFPKKDDKDLSQIYNRIAKEGAKLNLGMIYATQEVSSISANILKNTQNWFVAHLNNEDETKEIRKYYDYGDFVEGLVRFSAQSDKGFVRMKTYSNPFVVPVQVDRFPTPEPEGE